MTRGKYKLKRHLAGQRARERVNTVALNRNEDESATRTTARQPKTDDNKQDAMEKGWKIRRSVAERIKRSSFTDWLIMIFTGALVATATWQTVAIRDQLGAMRTDQRAWINVTVDRPQIAINKGVTSVVHFTDTGKTPARRLSFSIRIEDVHPGGTPHFEYAGTTTGEAGALFPNEPQKVPVAIIERSAINSAVNEPTLLTDTDFAELMDGTAHFAVYGWFDYDDVFGIHHWMKFCDWISYAPTFGSKECTEHNEIDNN